METLLHTSASKRARLKHLFAFIWLFIGLTGLSWIWLSNGPLEPMLPGSLSQAGIALDRMISIITRVAFFLWVGSGVAYVIVAFPEAKEPRAWISIGLGLASLLFTVPVLFFLPWFWSPIASGDNWPRDRFLTIGVHILFIAMNLACVITAFYDRPSPRSSWQRKTAILLAGLVAGLILPFSIYELYLFMTILFNVT